MMSDPEQWSIKYLEIMRPYHNIWSYDPNSSLLLFYRLELAQVQGNMEMKLNQVPLQPRRKHVNFDPNDPNMESEFENLELDNMDLRVRVVMSLEGLYSIMPSLLTEDTRS